MRAFPSTHMTASMLQILGITSRAIGADVMTGHRQSQSDTAMMTPQAPVHARTQHADHSLAGLPSFPEMAAGLAGRQIALRLERSSQSP